MKSIFVIAIGLALGVSAAAAFGASKHAAQKGPPPCSALTFRAVASGAADGDQQAGFYRSRYGTLALHADVKDGKPTDYFVLADGKRLTAAPAALPDWAASCAAAKKLPKPAALPPPGAPASASGWSSPIKAISGWRCSTASTVRAGTIAAPAAIDRRPQRRAFLQRKNEVCYYACAACKRAVISRRHKLAVISRPS